MSVKFNKAYELIKIPNGYVKKYADGTAEYHEKIKLPTLDVNTANGSIFYNLGGYVLGNYINFKFVREVPIVTVNISSSSLITWIYSMRNVGYSTKGQIFFGSSLARVGAEIELDYHAYGYWK